MTRPYPCACTERQWPPKRRQREREEKNERRKKNETIFSLIIHWLFASKYQWIALQKFSVRARLYTDEEETVVIVIASILSTVSRWIFSFSHAHCRSRRTEFSRDGEKRKGRTTTTMLDDYQWSERSRRIIFKSEQISAMFVRISFEFEDRRGGEGQGEGFSFDSFFFLVVVFCFTRWTNIITPGVLNQMAKSHERIRSREENELHHEKKITYLKSRKCCCCCEAMTQLRACVDVRETINLMKIPFIQKGQNQFDW